MPVPSNKEIKLIRSLSEKKFRDEHGLFVVEGDKMTSEALASGFEVKAIYRKAEIGEECMRKISSLAAGSPSLAVIAKPLNTKVEDISTLSDTLSGGGLFLALDAIRDPGNLGTILRIADWFGIGAVFASPDTVDLFNPKVVQATMGAIFRVKFHYVDLVPLCRMVTGELDGRVYGTFLDGVNIYHSDLVKDGGKPQVIVIGNEANGISDAVRAVVSDKLRIPSYPEGETGSESLNAAIATAITVAEFRRRD